MADFSVYPAKLLLFGEHLLLIGGSALAVPAPIFFGKWSLKSIQHTPFLWSELHTIVQLMPDLGLLDMDRLRRDVEMGWYVESNIPHGYGLGSSGALCAALYDRYASKTLTDPQDYAALKEQLGTLESQFHGQSSGIDPLTSYLNRPLKIQHRTAVQIVQEPDWKPEDRPHIFLLDTRQSRKTGLLVTWFLAQSTTETFGNMLQTEMLPAHEIMVNAWLSANKEVFMQSLKRISTLQVEHFTPMIPTDTTLLDFWWECLYSQDTYLKICGAGGGGFLLGFTTAPQRALNFAIANNIPIFFPFQNVPDTNHPQ